MCAVLVQLKGAGSFHSADQSKEGNLVLALPSIPILPFMAKNGKKGLLSWNFDL